MTIIEPNKNEYYSGKFIYLGLLLLILAVLSIYFYNLNVNLKYQISLEEKAIQQLEAVNADIRDKLYRILDAKNITAVVQKQNLVSDKNPDYLERQYLANR